jgi:RNase adaptor protein for sRNA GlmZ degradation
VSTTCPRSCCSRWSTSSAQQGYDKVGVAIDIRGGDSIAMLPQQLDALRARKLELQFLFLDAKTDTLLKRYSETRRRHPLASDQRTLTEAIAEERLRLAGWPNSAITSIPATSSPTRCASGFASSSPPRMRSPGLTLLFESFGFKHGIPLDAELVFDVRCLPNPHYEAGLRPLTGRDAPVIAFLEAEPEVLRMRDDIAASSRLAALLHPRQPQLPDGRHRLHRRPAPLGLSRRMAGSEFAALRVCWFARAACAMPRHFLVAWFGSCSSRRLADRAARPGWPAAASFPAGVARRHC